MMIRKKKILVIDDNENNLFLIRSILAKSHPDYQTITTKSGKLGLRIAEENQPETILLDIFMPEMDGYETCRLLKANISTSGIPVLMISAGGQNTDVRLEGLQAGADAITSKPFDRQEFIALVNVMLRIKSAEDKLKQQNRELQEGLTQIQEYQLKLKKMNAEMMLSEEKQRRRISEFLHDGISQILSLASIKLSATLQADHQQKTEKVIRESVDLINKAISETRSLTYDLSPPILYEFGLPAAIRWKLEQIEKTHQIGFSLKCNFDKPELTADLRALLFRIISELITNIVKHASADLIQIELRNEKNVLNITVADNGVGFDPKSPKLTNEPGGFGLFSIRERLDSIRGTLKFESERNRGTKVIFEIPI